MSVGVAMSLREAWELRNAAASTLMKPRTRYVGSSRRHPLRNSWRC